MSHTRARMHCPKRWIIAEVSPEAQSLSSQLKTSPLIAQMLLNRGLTEAEACRRFLAPSLKLLHEPQLIANLMRAAERIVRAVRDKQKIVIYGDYDVDGITGTAILWHAIRLMGGEADCYIPHRLEEGYGINSEAITQICDSGARLIISVDCGVTAIEEGAIARQRGVDLIITDHHDWQESPADGGAAAPLLPDCFCIVHPRLPFEGAPYPNPYLCGAGVALKLAWGMGQVHGGALRVDENYRRFLVEATALAALGTIADVVPLTGENRLLAHFGLNGLRRSELTGIRALIESAGLSGKALDSYHVGFLLAPRLNACGRMGHARQALDMLTRANATEARETAAYLEQQNRARQALEREILADAMQLARELGCVSDDCRGIVLAREGWHSGVIGIVASRIVGLLNRPTILISLSGDHGQGSGRSISGFHLARALNACREHLDGCGGHEMAAGLRLQSSKLAAFRDAFCAHARERISADMLIPRLHLDCVAELRQVTEALVLDMQRLGPFGMGNRRPLLCCLGVELACPPRRVGRSGEHVQILVRQNGVSMRCIAFNGAQRCEQLAAGAKLDIAVEPGLNEYNGTRYIDLELIDFRPA